MVCELEAFAATLACVNKVEHIPYNANRSRWKSFLVAWFSCYSWENFHDCIAFETPCNKKEKKSLENLRDWRLIHKNRKSFPLQMICIIRYVFGPAKTWHICTNYTCLENDTFLGHCLWLTHYLQNIFVLLLIYQCSKKISVTYLQYFKSCSKLNFKK